jgi:putative ABC transport system permease protein
VLFLARKNLLESPVRLLISAGGVGLAVMLILLMWAILQGTLSQAGALVRNTDAQVWVVQKGFTDLAHGYSVLPVGLERRLERMPGVRDANPIRVAARELRVHGKKQTLLVVGYDTATRVGGPWRYATDAKQPRGAQFVVDETFAETNDLSVGDVLDLPGGRRRIVALSAETNQFTNQLAFADVRDVAGLVRLQRAVNFYAVRTRPGRAADVARRIRREVSDATAFDKAAFLRNNEREIREGFQPILWVMVGVAFFVGLAVVGLTIYTATVEKSREYGVMSAIGARAGQLRGVVLRQAAIASALGFVLGCVLALPATWVIHEVAPKTELEFELPVFAIGAGSSVLMALVASYVPIRRIARLDPAAVFRA